MMRITPGSIAAAASTLLLALGGAAGCKKPTAEACPTGIFCPAGWHCAARAPQCIQGLCGNDHKDPGEACDDGNITDGDGCSADCTSDESCNNHIWDVKAGEKCDPTVKEWEGKCKDDCSATLTCGNHDVNEGEDCDPGSDGIPKETATCNLDCTARRCGDGIVNKTAGEECDGGNKDDLHATGQSETCNADCTISACGDHKTNELALEQCDDGDAQHGNGNGLDRNCLPSCQRNVCGDGNINRTIVAGRQVEDCDSGEQDANYNTGDCPYGQSCMVCSVCKSVPGKMHTCGDGTPDDGYEQCDLGKQNDQPSCPAGQANCATCTDHCQTRGFITAPVCGDGQPAPSEQCDNQTRFACGTCIAPGTGVENACTSVTIGPAHGSIEVLSTSGLVGITLEISDNAARDGKVFQYVNGTAATGTNIPIDIQGAGSLNTIANLTATAIKNAGLAFIVNQSGESKVEIDNTDPGKLGNVRIVVANEPPVDPPRNAALKVEGMDGGAGCQIGEVCLDDSDCLSKFCGPITKHCRTP